MVGSANSAWSYVASFRRIELAPRLGRTAISASREQSSCRFGILVEVKLQRFANNASGDHVIIDERKPKFSL
jgi:hypothetical protein